MLVTSSELVFGHEYVYLSLALPTGNRERNIRFTCS